MNLNMWSQLVMLSAELWDLRSLAEESMSPGLVGLGDLYHFLFLLFLSLCFLCV